MRGKEKWGAGWVKVTKKGRNGGRYLPTQTACDRVSCLILPVFMSGIVCQCVHVSF